MADSVHHIIDAVYDATGMCVTAGRYMYDKGQILRLIGFDLPAAFEAHIA